MSSLGVPSSTSCPSSSTKILSASSTELSRCAIVITVASWNSDRTCNPGAGGCNGMHRGLQPVRRGLQRTGGAAQGAATACTGGCNSCVYGARGAHGALYERVGLEVDRRGGLVEDDEGGPHEQRAREAEQLALAVREVDAALRDGVVEAAHRVRHLHALQRHPQLLRTVPPLGVEVRADRAREQHGLL